MTTTYRLLALAALAAFVLAGCASDPTGPVDDNGDGGDGSSNGLGGSDGGDLPANEEVECPANAERTTINQAGSSTVLPIAEAWAEEFGRCLNANIVVGGGGSSTGISRFCKGELDIGDASRPIKQSEIDTCRAAGIEPNEFTVAVDGLSVVVAKSNTFVDCLTVDQLHKIWTAGPAQVDTWNQLDPAWPDEDIVLFGPGTDSGTFDYFKEAIIHPKDGSSASTRSDYTPSEDDNVLVQGVSSSEYALGYFGLAYYEHNKDKLNVVKIDEGKGQGCVEPTPANVEAGTYKPLARPIFMYVDGTPTGTLHAYFEQGYSATGQQLVEEVGYIKLPAAKLAEMKAKLA